MEEENGYFRQIVKDAISDLKANKSAYVFYQEQVNEIKKTIDNIEVKEDDGIFYLTIKK